MPTCPNGHRSAADDWCEACGHRMAEATVAPAGGIPPTPPPSAPGGYGYPPPPPGSSFPQAPGQEQGGQGGSGYGYPGPGGHVPQQHAPSEACPQCGTPREAQAPFCEGCRYNFLTHTPTSYPPEAPQGGPPPYPQPPQPPPPGSFPQHGPPPGQFPGAPVPPAPQQPSYPGQPGHDQSFGYEASRPSQMNRPAEPLAPQPPPPQGPPFGDPGQGAYQQQMPQQQAPSGDWAMPAPGAPDQHAAGMQGGPPPAFPAQQQGFPDQQGYSQQQGFPSQQNGPGQDMQSPPMQVQGVPEQGMGPGDGGPAAWTAVITPDREYFTAMMGRSGPEAASLNLPAYSAEQQLPLTGQQITIGRRRQSTGEAPDIDLARTPEDPGVSHQHAVLVQQPDGNWAVVDQDSTNGTTINSAEDPIQPFVPVPLMEGDKVHVGAWTTITLRRS